MLYSLGGRLNYKQALSYYALAMDLTNGKSMHAMLGIHAAGGMLMGGKGKGKGGGGGGGGERMTEDEERLVGMADARIRHTYLNDQPELAPFLGL